jgi:hypothetical protein
MAHHEGISVIPYPVNRFLGMEYDLGLLSYEHRMKIDAAYYARYPASRKLHPMWQRFHDFWRGRPDPNWLYVIHEDWLKRKNLHAWRTLLPVNPRLLLLDHYYVASFLHDQEGVAPSMEWHLDSFSPDWEILSPGTHKFVNMGDQFDSLFLGGFEPRSEGAGLSHDLGVMAFRTLEDRGDLRLKFIPRNPVNTHILLVRGDLISEGKVVAEEEARPEQGWSEFYLHYSDIPKGDCLLRLEVQFFDEKSGWLPRRGNNVILVETDLSF